ncbi:MAG: hypothetical protein HQL11_06400, partial [Candidatus Omnitrophica bacterium]|nr:hypothetical protein [Candidatus Omnitrophota bacterium]
MSQRYQRITDILKAVKRDLEALLADHARRADPDDASRGQILEAVESLSDLIKHPKVSAHQELRYRDRAAALRSQSFHTPRSYIEETLRIRRHLGSLSLFKDMTEAAYRRARKGRARLMSLDDERVILEGLAEIHAWTARGFVYEKQAAEEHLGNALEVLNRSEPGAAEYQGVGRFLNRAIGALNERVSSIERITSNVKRRADSLHEESGDREVVMAVGQILADVSTARAAEADDAGSVRNLKRALGTARARLNALAKGHSFAPAAGEEVRPEPGYGRAQRQLVVLRELASRALKGDADAKMLVVLADKFIANLMVLQNDIEHKRSFRVDVISKNHKNTPLAYGRRLTRYVTPGTTLRTLLQRLKTAGEADEDSQIRLRKDWQRVGDLAEETLDFRLRDLEEPVQLAPGEAGARIAQSVDGELDGFLAGGAFEAAPDRIIEGDFGKLEVRRLKFGAGLPGAAAGAFLWRELTPVGSYDFLYRTGESLPERHLLAVFPVIEKGQSAGYLDLSAYQAPYELLRLTGKAGLSGAEKKKIRSGWAQYERDRAYAAEAIERYIREADAAGRDYQKEVPRGGSIPFFLLWVNPHTGGVEVKPVDHPQKELDGLLGDEAPGRKMLLVTFPSVYPPGLDDHAQSDHDYRKELIKRLKDYPFETTDVFFDDATGTGINVCLAAAVLEKQTNPVYQA